MSSMFENRPDRSKEFGQLIRQLKKKKPKDLDDRMHNLHEEAFQKIDCLECANCCKTTGPLFTDKDTERLAKHLRMKPSQFESTYLQIDEEGDRVLKSLPCPFLGSDNYCSVYEHRPKACREYPHTDRRKQYQILNLTEKNAAVCPAVYDILKGLESIQPK
jgi:uncharacterized protein